MKIEKINDRQICCIISSEDLINNQIKLSELAFGSTKAKIFFRDLMLKARNDCGFDGLNSPLMIEAIPQPPDAQNRENQPDIHFQGMDDVLNLVRGLREQREQKASQKGTGRKPAPAQQDIASFSSDAPVVEAFRFSDMDSVILAAHALAKIYDGESSLYTETAQDTYLLTVRCTVETPEEFNKICNILTEYAVPVHCSESGEYYLKEHGNELIADNALSVLAGF